MRLFALAVCLLTMSSLRADDDKVFSGPQPGEKLSAFQVQSFSGPAAGKQTELMARDAAGPVLLIFVHEVTRPAFQLMRPLDHYASQLGKKGLSTQFIWLTADKSKTEAFLNNARQSLSLKAPIGISLDGLEGPGNYGLNRKVTLTILLAKEHKVVANFAIVQPNETDAPKVLEAVAKVMGTKAPTLDDIRAAMKTGERPNPKKKGRPEELTTLMRRMIQKTNDADTVKKIAEEMLRWAGDDRQKQAELRDYCRQVAELGYGTEEAKKTLKQLAGR